MKRIHITNTTGETITEKLKTEFNATVEQRWGESILTFDNHLGKGTIQIISFDGGLTSVQYNVFLKVDISWHMTYEESVPLDFVYLPVGNMHFNKGAKESQMVQNSQNLIIAYKAFQDYNFIFPKQTELQVHFIRVIPNQFLDKKNTGINHISEGIRQIFQQKNRPLFLHFGSVNLMISEKIKEKFSCAYEGVIRTVMLEGLSLQILALQLAEHDSFLKREELPGSLNFSDLRKIEAAVQVIKDTLGSPSTIQDLANSVSINILKLQLGFKYVYCMTVNAYITEQKMLYAETLLKNTDLNVAEVSYSIGYSSKSYFTKRFKERFKMNPSEYKANGFESGL